MWLRRVPDSYAAWRDRLAGANDPAFMPIEEIDRKLAEGQAQFWCDGHAALVTEIVRHPGGAVTVDSLAAAGRRKSLTNVIEPAVSQWAAPFATHLRIIGRPGWQRVWREWTHEQSILTKAL